MKKLFLLILLMGLFANAQAEDAAVGKIQMTFNVTDDFGKPVSGATVGISFLYAKLPLAVLAISNTGKKQVDVITDTNGIAVISGDSVFDQHVSYGMKLLNGYYYTEGGEYRFQKVENGKWQPWNPTVEMVLKPILNPVPMYAKQNRDLKLPENDKPIGYDLLVGDWVAPYGKGLTNDLTFELHRQFTSVKQPFDATLTVTLPNDVDGIQSVLAQETTGLSLRLPRLAPKDGYEPKLVLRTFWEGEVGKRTVSNDRKDQNYFFRVRTKTDASGKIISALYGKIHGNIEFHFFDNSTARLRFTYYLNPMSNDQNMEFNTRSNLFKNLPSSEQVNAP